MQGKVATDRRSLLSRNLLLGSLDSHELDELLSSARVMCFDRDEVIFNKGDPGDGLYAILCGRLGIKTVSASGKEIFLNILEEGDVLGEIALLDGKERTAGAVAMEPTELLFIGRRHFIDLLERHPKLSVRLLGVLCTRLRWTSEIIEDTVFRDIRSRLARRLLSLAHVYGTEVADGTRIKLRISQENLGRMMGATRESINKELGAWQSQGVIGYSRGHITIRDAEVLERLANLA